MFVYLSTIVASINLTTLKDSASSHVRLHAVDSVNCYPAYAAALDAIETAADALRRKSITLKAGPVALLETFTAECAKKAVGDCAAVVNTQKGDVTATGPGDFSTKCKIDEPTKDAEDCYDAYDALLKAIEELNPDARKKPQMKAGEELDAFVTKCAKTAHSEACFAVISPLDTDEVPAYSTLNNIKTKCAIEKPPPPPVEDDGLIGFSVSPNILLFVSTIISFYFMV
jgi:hypothetical protein